MKLIIVESPTKAKTFAKLLPSDYTIQASVGHIRDLPTKKMGIDLEHDFAPEYEVALEKKKTVDLIKSLAKKADTIILATDADREGESISYHLAYLLGFIDESWPVTKTKEAKNLQRIVFHEITKTAIEEALAHPGKLNLDLVEAQQARRLLDRIVGYKLSPLLWKKMGKRWLSAGRVQTVAQRFIVEREKEIAAFTIEDYYKIKGFFETLSKIAFEAKLIAKGPHKYYSKKTIPLFDGTYTYSKTDIDEKLAAEIKSELMADTCFIQEVSKSTTKRTPPPPYTTSLLQQDAGRLLGYSSKMTMSLAQKLYEVGHITYHRTDSVNLSTQFVEKAQGYVKKQYGVDYLEATPRVYKAKSKVAQEAHEAIRPTKLVSSVDVGGLITVRHQKLYSLIFQRAVATVMAPATVSSYKLTIESKKGYIFESSFETIDFPGYLALYGKNSETSAMTDIKKGETIQLTDLVPEASQTLPPPRYTEASLIRTLESKDIGRPSTYAPIISTIQTRNYVEKQEGKFYATTLGTAVCDYLAQAFPTVFDMGFTAEMENTLDDIANGKQKTVPVLSKFYTPFEKILQKEMEEKTYIDIQEKSDEICDLCGSPMMIRFSKYGKFHACTKYPECKGAKPFMEKIDKPCPACGSQLIVRYTKTKRKFFGCSNYPACTYAAWNLNQVEKDREEGVKQISAEEKKKLEPEKVTSDKTQVKSKAKPKPRKKSTKSRKSSSKSKKS